LPLRSARNGAVAPYLHPPCPVYERHAAGQPLAGRPPTGSLVEPPAIPPRTGHGQLWRSRAGQASGVPAGCRTPCSKLNVPP